MSQIYKNKYYIIKVYICRVEQCLVEVGKKGDRKILFGLVFVKLYQKGVSFGDLVFCNIKFINDFILNILGDRYVKQI